MSRASFAPDQDPAASRTEMLASGTYGCTGKQGWTATLIPLTVDGYGSLWTVTAPVVKWMFAQPSPLVMSVRDALAGTCPLKLVINLVGDV